MKITHCFIVFFYIFKHGFALFNGASLFKFSERLGGIARRNDIGRNVFGNNRPCTNNTIRADCDTFADLHTLAKPDIFAYMHRRARAGRGETVVDFVPIGIGNIDAAGNHHIIANGDMVC